MSVLDRSLSRTGKTAAVSLVFAAAVIAALAVPAGATVRVEAGSGGLAVTRPVVLSVQVRNRSVPYTGGVVHFTVRLRSANTCKLGVAGTSAVAIAFSKAWQRCSNGIFRQAVRLGRNSEQTARNVAFRVYLRQGTEIYWYPLGNVRVAGAPPPPTTTTTTTTVPGPENNLTVSQTFEGGAGLFSTSGSSCSPNDTVQLEVTDQDDRQLSVYTINAGAAGWMSGLNCVVNFSFGEVPIIPEYEFWWRQPGVSSSWTLCTPNGEESLAEIESAGWNVAFELEPAS